MLSTEGPKEAFRRALRSLFSSADGPCKHTRLSGVPAKDLGAFSPEGLCAPKEARAPEGKDHSQRSPEDDLVIDRAPISSVPALWGIIP